jgi:hypothetical protein
MRLLIHHSIAHSIVRSRSQRSWPKLYRRRVQHDADRGTEGLGREVRAELGADDAGVAVWAGDLAPDDAWGVSSVLILTNSSSVVVDLRILEPAFGALAR